MKKLIVLSLGFVAFILVGCPDDFYPDGQRFSFRIENDSPHSIGVWSAHWIDTSMSYSDTALPSPGKYVIEEAVRGNSWVEYAPSISWEEVFNKIPSDTLSVFIFHSDTLKKYSWQEVRDGYKVLKRYDLSHDDLKRMNFTITYP